MEYRLSKRVTGKLGLLLYKRSMPVATGQIRDASESGLFIATNYTDVQLNQTLEVEFRFPDRYENSFRRLKGLVVRKSEHGLGVNLDGVENDGLTIESLLSWLQNHNHTFNYFPPIRRNSSHL